MTGQLRDAAAWVWDHALALVMWGVVLVVGFIIGAFLLLEIWWHG